MKKIRVLVFPCGSEIALEIHAALQFSSHIELFGVSSTPDHGKFVYKNYREDVPFVINKNFISKINDIIIKEKIDFIFPAHDDVILKLVENENLLRCPVLTSPKQTVEICRSKQKTYQHFDTIIPVPKVYVQDYKDLPYPLFLKPDAGQGSKGVVIVRSADEARFYLSKDPTLLLLEYLPGKEFTVDCFTDRHGKLRFIGGRQRIRIMNGISVNTIHVEDSRFKLMAEEINSVLKLRGVWFFQVKESSDQDLVLMEIAPRVAGSMSLHRNKGVNLPLLTIFDRLEKDVEIIQNSFNIQLDRALTNRFITTLKYKDVYVDLDDSIIINGKINWILIGYLYQCLNKNIHINLITKHKAKLESTLKKFRLSNIFTTITQIKDTDEKISYIKERNAIFIDDSFSERYKISKSLQIPVFDISEIESLLDWRY